MADAVSPQVNIIDLWGFFKPDNFIQDLLSGKVEIGCKYREAVRIIAGLGPDAPNRVHGVIFLLSERTVLSGQMRFEMSLLRSVDSTGVTVVLSRVDETVDQSSIPVFDLYSIFLLVDCFMKLFICRRPWASMKTLPLSCLKR